MKEKLKIYLSLMRLDKPIGIMLLFWPCAFGVALNSQDQFDYLLFLKFLLGSFLLRPAGCIINDLWDREFDPKVERTKSRPIAAKKVSVIEAIALLGFILFLGLLLLLTLKTNTIILTLFSVPLVILYPLMKRITYLPQMFLGLTFNFGILIACFELKGQINIETIILYLGGIFWTMGYDTIYGFMDIDDDRKIGLKSIPLLIENKNPVNWLIMFYFIFSLSILTSCVMVNKLSNNYDYIILILINTHLAWQILTLNIKNKANCLERFKSNKILGFLIFSLFLF